MTLPFLERELKRLLASKGRDDLAESAVGSVEFTDDGGTIYLHVLPRKGWPHKAQGRAYVLAWEDYAPEGSSIRYCYRWLVREGRQAMAENVDDIIRWLEGR
jgi:hypothetical protein